MRVDEALRIYLSEFRLPGEAPLISSLLEHFAAHWRVRKFSSIFLESIFYSFRNVIIFNLPITMQLLV
jgi:hypothetical protein